MLVIFNGFLTAGWNAALCAQKDGFRAKHFLFSHHSPDENVNNKTYSQQQQIKNGL